MTQRFSPGSRPSAVTFGLVVLSLCACGEGAVPEEPTRVGAPVGASTTSAQRFALTSKSTNGWSLTEHAAVPQASADFTINASGCRGGLSTSVLSTRFTFCPAGKGFANIDAVPSTMSNCDTGGTSISAGGSYGQVAVGDGYVVLQGGVAVGRLRIADHTLVPQSWDGQPVQVTLEYLSAR